MWTTMQTKHSFRLQNVTDRDWRDRRCGAARPGHRATQKLGSYAGEASAFFESGKGPDFIMEL